MWSNRDEDRLPCIKFARSPKSIDEQNHAPP